MWLGLPRDSRAQILLEQYKVSDRWRGRQIYQCVLEGLICWYYQGVSRSEEFLGPISLLCFQLVLFSRARASKIRLTMIPSMSYRYGTKGPSHPGTRPSGRTGVSTRLDREQLLRTTSPQQKTPQLSRVAKYSEHQGKKKPVDVMVKPVGDSL